MDPKKFNWYDKITGWFVFGVAAIVYLMTIEPSSSLWDCSEFVATSYKLEVGHPPGAPLFMMLARLATLFAPTPHYVPHMVNAMNALASAFCILFLFWTLTHLSRRLLEREGRQLNTPNIIAILGTGVVGALAYTFTDTFWFSAVEGEVYALSSMFTTLVVWLMLKWESEADSPHAMRWIVLIAYLMGLSIGVHILNLLTIPALVFIYYFRRTSKVTFLGISLYTLYSLLILYIINGLIIPYTMYLGTLFDVFFTNVCHLPVNTGAILFVFLLFGILGYLVYFTHTRGQRVWNLVALCTTMILLGFSSYATVTIRATVNPPMNSNNPSNPASLQSVLNRDQYGNRPLLYGAYYSAPVESYTEKTFYHYDRDQKKYVKRTTIDEYVYPEEFMHFFPRMWNYGKSEQEYKSWAAYRTKKDFEYDKNGKIVRDANGNPIRTTVIDYGREVKYRDGNKEEVIVEPTFMENIHFFFSYQLNYMYWRYFLWNFVGRQDDIQAGGGSTITHGNWLSGIKFIDSLYLGPQDNLPREVEQNKARNKYYFLPFLLGLLGLVYQLNRDSRNFSIVMWLFIMMGVAEVVYFNTSPGEVRERDYVFAGSFYAFCIWIGFGVLSLCDLFNSLIKKRVVSSVLAIIVALSVPGILAAENWDDHDRSHRCMARDVGYNYLMSMVEQDGVSPILINYGDNDTFPVWFNQEVDGVRTDVRVMNSSYLDGEWYVDEMRCKANDADGVKFSLPRHKYTFANDWIPVFDKIDDVVDIKDLMEFIRSDDSRTKVDVGFGEKVDYIPAKRIALPVDKDAAIASGIVRSTDRDLMVDTVYINLSKGSYSRSELMLLDALATFDWKRPIYFTQVYILEKFGLMDYLQYDGYSYRLVPILTPNNNDSWNIGRIDSDYAYDVLMHKLRFGNLADRRVYVDYFTQYNLMVAKAREAFARVAKTFILEDNFEKAEKLLDRGLEVLPIDQLRFTLHNTYPFIEGYYAIASFEKGDELLLQYADNIIDYIEYYISFGDYYADEVEHELSQKLDDLEQIYLLAAVHHRDDIVRSLNEYYRSLGAEDKDLILTDQEKQQIDSLNKKS
ncbi:MAG: DUF2723 domain-containing protein [Alistipes sp.]|nr:DUF2723 domain-containing protein [Candidatus Alistipes equi]